MFVYSRVFAGKMRFDGHGVGFEHDIFTQRGRAAWAIETFLDLKLPPFTEDMQQRDLDWAIKVSREAVDAHVKKMQ